MKNFMKAIGFSITVLIFVTIVLYFVLGITENVCAADRGVTKNVIDKSKVIILVGDSRIMQMSYLNASKRKNYVLVYSNGGGINCINPKKSSLWIGDKLKKVLKNYPKAPVVFSLGVNSNGNPSKNFNRTKIYDYYIKNYPKHTFIISSVGGTAKTIGSYSNKNVKSFNKKLKNKYYTNLYKVKNKTGNNKIYYYDLYSYLKSANLINPGKSYKGTRDGLHYKNNVYTKWLKNLRKFVKDNVKN